MYMRIFVVMLGVRRARGEGEGRSHDGFERQRSAVYITPVRRLSIPKMYINVMIMELTVREIGRSGGSQGGKTN